MQTMNIASTITISRPESVSAVGASSREDDGAGDARDGTRPWREERPRILVRPFPGRSKDAVGTPASRVMRSLFGSGC